MMNLLLMISLQLLFCFGYLIAQNNNFANVDKVLSEYAQKILDEKEELQSALKIFSEKNSLQSFPVENIELLKLFLKLDDGLNCSLIEKKDLEKYNRIILKAGFSIDEFYDFYLRYHSVTLKHKSLMYDDIIHKDNSSTFQTFSRLDELAFYGIKKDDVVAQVGVGVGYSIELLSYLFPENEFIVSENDPTNISLLQYLAQENNNINVTTGDQISCGLEEMEIDIIILRNVLYQIDKKEAFLFSVVESIEKNGQIIIVAYFKENNLPDKCNDQFRMKKRDFDELIAAVNLKLVDLKILQTGEAIFKFELD